MTNAEQRETPATGSACLLPADDLLEGAEAIGAFLFGNLPVKKARRRVYNLVDADALPIFRMGALVCARKSTLRQWIEDQERQNAKGARP